MEYKDKKKVVLQDVEADGVIEGRNAVTEALRAGVAIDKIFIAKGETDRPHRNLQPERSASEHRICHHGFH